MAACLCQWGGESMFFPQMSDCVCDFLLWSRSAFVYRARLCRSVHVGRKLTPAWKRHVRTQDAAWALSDWMEQKDCLLITFHFGPQTWLQSAPPPPAPPHAACSPLNRRLADCIGRRLLRVDSALSCSCWTFADCEILFGSRRTKTTFVLAWCFFSLFFLFEML